MFTIIYENETHKQWASDIMFSSFSDVSEYLLKEGFVKRGRVYERINYNWIKFQKAYIHRFTIYENKEDE